MIKVLSVLVLLASSIASAEYLSDYQVEKPVPPPSKVYGLGYTGRLYAGGLDHWADLFARFRMGNHWALQGNVGYEISGSYLAGIEGHWLRKETLMEDGAEDFVSFGFSYIAGNAQTPLISIGYGRDVLPWSKATFGMRLNMHIDYALAENGMERETTGVLGIKETRLNKTMLAFNVMLFFL